MATPESGGQNERKGDEGIAEEKAKGRKGGHVLVVPWPAQGHINPMMHLSLSLAAQGVLVTFVNTQFNHDRILRSRASSPQPQAHLEGSIHLVGVPDGLGYDEYVANFSVPKQAQALVHLEPLLMKLVEELQPPVTCIIADLFVISTPAVARRFHIPHVAFWTQSAASYASHVFFTQNHTSLKVEGECPCVGSEARVAYDVPLEARKVFELGHVHFDVRRVERFVGFLEKLCNEGNVDKRVISCVPSCPTMSFKELPTFLQPCDTSDFYFSYLKTNFEMAPHNTFVLMNTFEELEVESLAYVHTPNMLCIGPILPSQFILNDNTSSLCDKKANLMSLGTCFWVEDHEGCLPWLHQQKPSSVLYVSFGSITTMTTRQLVEFATGLEASFCPFLMVVRPEMMKGGVCATFPDGFIDRMRKSGRAIFVAWAPQLEVLAHPAIGGFLTHAGWNSTLESICRGVPMLCWPYFGDQMLNTRCIVDTWKIGLEFVMEKVTINEEWSSRSYGDIDEITTISNNKGRKSEEASLVKDEEIEQKVRQLMDPLASIEIRNRMNHLSQAAKRAYESSWCSNFKSLLDIISH